IETRIKDLDTNIKKLQQSGISDLLTSKEKFSKENEAIVDFQSDIETRENQIDELAQNIEISDIDFSTFDEQHSEELKQYSQIVKDGFAKIKSELLNFKEQASQLKST